MKMKVLELFCKSFDVGGEETIVFNIYENMNRKNIQIDFCAQYNGGNEEYRNKIINNGDHFFAMKKRNDNIFSRGLYFLDVYYLLKHQKYDIVHIHSGNLLGFALGVIVAKKNTHKIILHSHNTGIKSWKNSLLKKVCTPLMQQADIFLACSKEAATFKFPIKVIEQNQYEVIKNGIPYELYLYNESIRIQYRKKFNINEKELVLGFVGRLVDQKNPLLLLDILKQLKIRKPNVKLIIVGDGKLKCELEKNVKIYGLQKYVLFLGSRSDVYNIMQAFDVFLLPSRYEGLGIVAIEAQASGLPTFVSSAVPEEANISNLFYKLHNDNSIDEWVKLITKHLNHDRKMSMVTNILNSGFSIQQTANRIQEIYEGALK